MSSTQARPKVLGVGTGYFINVTDNRSAANPASIGKVLMNNGTDALPSFSTNVYAVSSTYSSVCAQGGIMKDLGKTLVSSGRVFRKVQLLISSSTTEGIGGVVGNGSGAGPVPDYLTAYIELPGGGAGSGALLAGLAGVARLG